MDRVPPDGHILVVEDDARMRDLLEKVLARDGHTMETCGDGLRALKLLEENVYDLIIADIRMPKYDGMELLSAVRKQYPNTTFIMMTAFGTIDSAVEAMKLGAFDYISKPFKMDEILIVVRRALDERRLRQEVSMLRDEVQRKYEFSNIIGKSKPMQEVFQLIHRVAASRSTVLISGKSGTGKELVAKAIHYNSSRRNMSFVPLSCGALPESLLESELFGHVRGAFTGAVVNKKGLFEEAHHGTIFLDEIGDLSASIQVKLLRVLQEREIKPVGGTKTSTVDVRLIAATNINLEEAVRQGRFREDLFFRLNVIPIHLPDLKDRPDDIPLLVNHFLNRYAVDTGKTNVSIAPEAMNFLIGYSWPGNVRELENVMERMLTLSHDGQITAADLPEPLRSPATNLLEAEANRGASLRDLERDYIKTILIKTGGHQINAAKILGIDRRTLYRKMKTYGLK